MHSMRPVSMREALPAKGYAGGRFCRPWLSAVR